jgi:hypothetical protein
MAAPGLGQTRRNSSWSCLLTGGKPDDGLETAPEQPLAV